MPTRKRTSNGSKVKDYRYGATRKNIPPAGPAAQGVVSDVPKTRYFYVPHLTPVFRFDETVEAEMILDLLKRT